MYLYRLKRYDAWLVKQKPFPAKIFSDKKYGGYYRAMIAALNFRDTRKPNPPRTPCNATNTRNTSGKIGVSKFISPWTGKHTGWVAFWWENGRQINRVFSFKKHGSMAYLQAKQCRLDAEARLKRINRP